MGATSIVLESFCPSKNVVGITQFDRYLLYGESLNNIIFSIF